MSIWLLNQELKTELEGFQFKEELQLDGNSKITGIWKNSIQTHIFWVEGKDNTIIITGLKDLEFNPNINWTPTDPSQRSHKGIAMKGLNVILRYCIKNKLWFKIVPNTEGWWFWEKISPLIIKKHNNGEYTIVLGWDELINFNKDLKQKLEH